MLSLTGPDSRIDLDVLGYQFSSTANDNWDSEWLQVLGRAECPRGKWKFTDPCLTTFDLVALASWLHELPSCGQSREIGFTEPNLRFEHVEEITGDVLYVYFSQEASPPWATEEERFRDGYALHIPFASISFDAATAAVEQLYRKYPVRTNRGGG